MKCNDCGQQITDENYKRDRSQTRRHDICDGCWQTRDDLINGKIVPLGGAEFIQVQRKMANGRGTAKKYIDQLRARQAA